MPRGADGFTWCYNKVSAARRDFSAKLRAQGKDDKAIQAAVEEATKAGTLKPTPFGTMSYRLYGKTRSHPAAVGAVGAGRHAGHDRRDDGERA